MVSGNQGTSFDAMTWTRRFDEFDPSDKFVLRFLSVRGEGAEPHLNVRHDLIAYWIRYRRVALEVSRLLTGAKRSMMISKSCP